MDSAIEGEAAKAEGQRRAAAGKPDWWWALARQWAKKFIAELEPGQVFKAEDLRAWAGENGFSTPGDARAWGTVMRLLATEGVIVSVGRVKSTTTASHRGWRELWARKTGAVGLHGDFRQERPAVPYEAIEPGVHTPPLSSGGETRSAWQRLKERLGL